METFINEQPERLHSFSEKELACRQAFQTSLSEGWTLWHLCTPGTFQSIIFETAEDYTYGMVAVATAAYDSGIRIITFELMSNHIHVILRCRGKEESESFFHLFRKRLVRYFHEHGKLREWRGFVSELYAIDSLEAARNQIAYTNRNNFVVDPDQTPFSYPYGANGFYFNPLSKMQQGVRYGNLSLRARMRILHSKKTDYPDDWIVMGRYISPISFCECSLGERFFRDARHYLYKITRNLESYKELSELLGDGAYYTDEELVGIMYSLCREKYARNKPSLLTPEEKKELAKELYYDYNSDIAKISRLLHFPLSTLEALFPPERTPRKSLCR